MKLQLTQNKKVQFKNKLNLSLKNILSPLAMFPISISVLLLLK